MTWLCRRKSSGTSLLLWKPEVDCVNSYSNGPQWITASRIQAVESPLHVDSGLDCAIGLGQQGTSKDRKSVCTLGYPLLLAAFGTHPQYEHAWAMMDEEGPWSLLLANLIIRHGREAIQDQSVLGWSACPRSQLLKFSLTLWTSWWFSEKLPFANSAEIGH